MDKEKFDLERWAIAENLSKNFHINGEGWDASDFEWASHCLQMDGYRKSEDVAREIFEEIEREINDALQSNYKVLPLIEQSEALWNRVNGKIDALRGIEGYIAELKNKYTVEK